MDIDILGIDLAKRRSSRAIDKYAFQLSAFLKTEAAKSRKQRRTLMQTLVDGKEAWHDKITTLNS